MRKFMYQVGYGIGRAVDFLFTTFRVGYCDGRDHYYNHTVGCTKSRELCWSVEHAKYLATVREQARQKNSDKLSAKQT